MDFTARINQIVEEMTLEEKLNLSTGKTPWSTYDMPRFGVPSIRMGDGTNGTRVQKNTNSVPTQTFFERLSFSFDSKEALERTYPATCFPTGSAVACTWNRELIADVGKAVAEECRAIGVRLLLGPGMNIRRHPLTARNFEYFSEDPCLSGDISAAYVKGLQDNGVGACIKHYVCHNSDTRRTRSDSIVGKRALEEIYLSGYKRCIGKADPVAVMTAYNKVNGVDMCGDNTLVKDKLKKEWNYKGTVICDFGGVKNIADATRGGIDLQMPREIMSVKALRREIESGLLSESLLDERCKRILNLVFRVSNLTEEHPETDFSFDNHHLVARKAAEESIVLLKNDRNLLPLDRNTSNTIAVIGRLAKEPLYQGTGCAIINSKTVDIPYDNIISMCGNNTVKYAKGYNPDGTSNLELKKEAEEIAKEADIVLLFVGEPLPREDDDYNRKEMVLPSRHEELITYLSQYNKNIICVLSCGDAICMPWSSNVSAILNCWYCGEAMGSAVSRILFGDVNPSGKLAVTIPKKESDSPAFLSFSNDEFIMEYGEGIFVGYRYYDKKQLEPLYPFGHGLSYTSFEYSDLNAAVNDDETAVDISIKIRNTGTVKGKETVQIYIREINPTVMRPERELKDFDKIELFPGEERIITFSIPIEELGYYDATRESWVTNNGIYEICAATSSRDIKLKSRITIMNQIIPEIPLKYDTGFYELLSHKNSSIHMKEFLVAHGLLSEAQYSEDVEMKLKKSFWSIRSYFDSKCDTMEFEDVDELIAKVLSENNPHKQTL